jgi:hypothetical protein
MTPTMEAELWGRLRRTSKGKVRSSECHPAAFDAKVSRSFRFCRCRSAWPRTPPTPITRRWSCNTAHNNIQTAEQEHAHGLLQLLTFNKHFYLQARPPPIRHSPRPKWTYISNFMARFTHLRCFSFSWDDFRYLTQTWRNNSSLCLLYDAFFL